VANRVSAVVGDNSNGKARRNLSETCCIEFVTSSTGYIWNKESATNRLAIIVEVSIAPKRALRRREDLIFGREALCKGGVRGEERSETIKPQ